jgi:hypothetical protein
VGGVLFGIASKNAERLRQRLEMQDFPDATEYFDVHGVPVTIAAGEELTPGLRCAAWDVLPLRKFDEVNALLVGRRIGRDEFETLVTPLFQNAIEYQQRVTAALVAQSNRTRFNRLTENLASDEPATRAVFDHFKNLGVVVLIAAAAKWKLAHMPDGYSFFLSMISVWVLVLLAFYLWQVNTSSTINRLAAAGKLPRHKWYSSWAWQVVEFAVFQSVLQINDFG